MERDFMGLNSKDSVVVVKEEAVEGCKESVFSKSSAVQWPSSDRYQAFSNRQVSEIQKSMGGGTHFSMTAYPMQQSGHNDTKQPVAVTMSNPFFRAQFGGAPVKQQLLSIASPHAAAGSLVAGTTEPWYNSKTTGPPAQLTIFYGGMVNVYDDISPEKAQAIMLLAGNGASVSAANTPLARMPTPRTQAGDAVYGNQPPINTQPCSAVSSAMSMSSHPTGGPTNKDDGAKTVGVSTKMESPRVINSLDQVISAVPQARKASLARFLEKRKERVMASAPYSVSKSSSDCSSKPGPSGTGVVAAGGDNRV